MLWKLCLSATVARDDFVFARDAARPRPGLATLLTDCCWVTSVSFKRAGILGKRNAMSKRKFHEVELLAPQSMHSFSTSEFRAKIFWKLPLRAANPGLSAKWERKLYAKFSTGALSTSCADHCCAAAGDILSGRSKSKIPMGSDATRMRLRSIKIALASMGAPSLVDVR